VARPPAINSLGIQLNSYYATYVDHCERGDGVPLQDYMEIISVDDHLIEPPHVWQDRLPEKYREAGPRIVENEQGRHVWLYEDRVYVNFGLNAVAGKPPEQFGTDPLRYEDMIPGCYDPAARVKDMDLDGVKAAICFPTFPGFAGRVFAEGEDKDLALLCVQAWNDFSVDEWSATASDRLIPLAIVPFWDPVATAAEIRRVAARGAKAVTFPESPAPLGLPSFHTDHWEPVFDALEETGLPMQMHFGSSSHSPGFSADAPFAVAIATFGTNLMWAAVDLILSPVLHRHPALQILLAEGGIGWIPYILERTDYVWERHRWYQDINREVRPSELFRRHFYGCFIDDVHGIANRSLIGIDRLTFEVDYPHSDSNWPNSRKRAEEVFADVPDDEVHKIVELNAKRLFGLG
jgi:predicted TIM-barrel fold metal-dependent hydrolase